MKCSGGQCVVETTIKRCRANGSRLGGEGRGRQSGSFDEMAIYFVRECTGIWGNTIYVCN